MVCGTGSEDMGNTMAICALSLMRRRGRRKRTTATHGDGAAPEALGFPWIVGFLECFPDDERDWMTSLTKG